MERISLFVRTTKKSGKVKLRFRLIDGRAVQLYHTTNVDADVRDLAKYNSDGTLKNKVAIYDRAVKKQIDCHIKTMGQAYRDLCSKMEKTHISGELFEAEIARILTPETPSQAENQKESLLSRFERFIEQAYKDGVFGDNRRRNYYRVKGIVERFISIKHLKKISAGEVTADMLAQLQEYMRDEYKYVERYPRLFADLDPRRLPKVERDGNTTATLMKMIQAFYNDLLEREELELSPFQKLGRKKRASIMREQYEDPHFLRKEEFLKVLNAEVSERLEATRDAFVLQCSFGFRISDFMRMSMDKVAVSEDGIPYIHYLPQKTMRNNTRRREIETPIMRFALDIIKKYQFDFPILRYAGGHDGYNSRIRKLLEHCGIDRAVKTFDEEKQDNVYTPLYKFGSSKLCRSTHVDMMSKVQVDLYASGLHSRGSNAVHHYTQNELRDRFALMCVAFGQPIYKVDKDLNVVEEQ